MHYCEQASAPEGSIGFNGCCGICSRVEEPVTVSLSMTCHEACHSCRSSQSDYSVTVISWYDCTWARLPPWPVDTSRSEHSVVAAGWTSARRHSSAEGSRFVNSALMSKIGHRMTLHELAFVEKYRIYGAAKDIKMQTQVTESWLLPYPLA